MLIINLRIKKEICLKTIADLSDDKLINEYKKTVSVKNEIIKLENILIKYINDDIKELIINEYLVNLIPARTKGVIRGNKFNQIVKNNILNFNLDKNKFEIKFEKNAMIIIQVKFQIGIYMILSIIKLL